MTTGVWVLAAAAMLAVVVGVAKQRYDGRFRAAAPAGRGSGDGPGSPDGPPVLGPQDLAGAALGDRATLVQFSSAFCQPCRATRRVLADIADVVPGVTHVEIDAEAHLDLVRRLEVRRTPTTLVLDARGRVATRASGLPRKEQVLAALPL